MISKGSINRLGDKIRNEKDLISEPILDELQQYRTSHKDSLARVFNTISHLSKKVHPNTIVTYRIKRFESIIKKLARYPKMQFSRMWDIGGCRCILRNDNDVYKLKKLIEEKLEVKKIYDYIEKPQDEGYRSLHLFVSVPNDKIVIEVQLRNQIDHNWATLVEITDLLFDSKLKEYKENKELLRFHFLLSKNCNLTLSEKKEVAHTIKNYEYFKVLSNVFSRNYLQVRRQWFDIENRSNHKYFLIETKKEDIPKITSFQRFNEAEAEYYNVYKSSHNANVVLTHLPNPNYKQISIAYSNYILTFHSFLNECYKILESLISDSLRTKKYWGILKIYNLYNYLVFLHIKNLLVEVASISKFTATLSNRNVNRKKIKEWESDIQKQVKQSRERARKLSNAFRENLPNSSLARFLVKQIVTIIGIKYRLKIKRLKTSN